MKIKSFSLIVVIIILFASVGFGGPLKEEIQFGGVQAASGHYVYCVVLAELINKKVPEAHITVIETGASIENLQLAYRGDIDMGIASFDSAVRAYNGQDEFKGKQNANLRLLWPSAFLPMNIIVNQDSGVKSLYDLEGRKFNGGGTGTATEGLSLRLFEALGIHPKWFRGSVSLARDAMVNRQIDGFIKTLVPDPTVMEAARAVPIRFLELSDGDFDKARAKYPGIFTRAYIPANSYGKDLPPKNMGTFCAVVVDFATSKLPQDLVYKMAKTVYENKGALGKSWTPFIEGFAQFPTPYVEVAPIYIHAGVIQLCKELGVVVPERVIPPEYKEKK